MELINGKYSSAKVFSKTIDSYAISQIKNICDNEVSSGCVVHIMPDVHPGKVAPIGLSMTLSSRILPYLVGLDVGCGMSIAKIVKHRGMEFKRMDSVVRENVPSGFEVRKTSHRFVSRFDFSLLHCKDHIYKQKASSSLGTLGSGNHFIEIDADSGGDFYLIVHSGSRRLGKELTDYYMEEGRRALKQKGLEIPYELSYLEASLMDSYLHDIALVQDFAALNRLAMSAYRASMKGIYSSCIEKGTLDEAPFAYRSVQEILQEIDMSVSVTEVLKPVYNFKAASLGRS